ncbi:MAG: ATP synthase F1 subunit epsilon [Candidatus Aminicenantes bacterium]|nr:ATP synthase F1 subunit epsilon [Candidatus Aminicenantes bacterium]
MNQVLPSSLLLKVITPRELLVETEVQEVALPGLDGYLGILPGHRPLLTALGEGKITYRKDGQEESFPIQGGYAEILPDKVLVFTESGQDETEQSTEG